MICRCSEIPGFLSQEECDHIKDLAQKETLFTSSVKDSTEREDPQDYEEDPSEDVFKNIDSNEDKVRNITFVVIRNLWLRIQFLYSGHLGVLPCFSKGMTVYEVGLEAFGLLFRIILIIVTSWISRSILRRKIFKAS